MARFVAVFAALLVGAVSVHAADDPPALEPLGTDQLEALTTICRAATARTYPRVAALSRWQAIDAGARIYFGVLRPFARLAGIDDDLDWSAPRDIERRHYRIFERTSGPNFALSRGLYSPYE